METYVIYGYKQGADFDDANRDVDSGEHVVYGDDGRKLEPIYDTTDKEEAKTIMRNGGFLKDDEWYIAVRGRTEES